MKRILVIHGPNLNLLGKREREIYGSLTLSEINDELKKEADQLGADLEIFQSNSEGAIIEKIHSALGNFDGILINPAAFTHTSIALRDCLLATELPVVEVHLSNIYAREEFRHKSFISDIVAGKVVGFGYYSYILGLRGIMYVLGLSSQSSSH